MTVSKLSKNRIKIALSDSEVHYYFGSYEKIAEKSKTVQNTINNLLRQNIDNYTAKNNQNKFIVEVIAQKDIGCEITVTAINKSTTASRNLSTKYMLEFCDTESMTKAIIHLYTNRRYKHLSASLYKMHSAYRLTLTVPNKINFPLTVSEFYLRKTDSPFEIAYTEEYGKLLIKDNAISHLGSLFSKGS